MEFLFVLAKAVAIWLDVTLLAMLIRAIYSLFGDPESNLYQFLGLITEPAILPIRAIFARFDIGQDSPLDLPFFATYLLLTGLQVFLPAL